MKTRKVKKKKVPDTTVSTKASTKRLKNTICSKRVIFGSIAWFLGRNKEEKDKGTHKWSCYVRGFNNENISTFIRKVVFSLHSSFPNPTRVVKKPPFEIYESGWGEFEIMITLHFHDETEPPVELYHYLRLFPVGTNFSAKRPICSEQYEELLFVHPREDFYKSLINGKKKLRGYDKDFKDEEHFSDRPDLHNLELLDKRVLKELFTLAERYKTTQKKSRELLKEIASYQQILVPLEEKEIESTMKDEKQQ